MCPNPPGPSFGPGLPFKARGLPALWAMVLSAFRVFNDRVQQLITRVLLGTKVAPPVTSHAIVRPGTERACSRPLARIARVHKSDADPLTSFSQWEGEVTIVRDDDHRVDLLLQDVEK
jgi:hypothetical protein